MNALNLFVELVDQQKLFLCNASELDGYFLDTQPDQWNVKRGARRCWTRSDKRRHDLFFANAGLGPHNDRFVNPKRWPSTRLSTALRLFDLASPVQQRSKAAISHCEAYASTKIAIAPLVLDLTLTHIEWLDWMRCNEPSDVEERWHKCRNMLEGMLITLPMLHDISGNPAPDRTLAKGFGVSTKTITRWRGDRGFPPAGCTKEEAIRWANQQPERNRPRWRT